MFTVTGKVYRDGNPLASFDLGTRETQYDAAALAASYICTLLVQGGTATFDKPADEYRVAMPDGTVEYVKAPWTA